MFRNNGLWTWKIQIAASGYQGSKTHNIECKDYTSIALEALKKIHTGRRQQLMPLIQSKHQLRVLPLWWYSLLYWQSIISYFYMSSSTYCHSGSTYWISYSTNCISYSTYCSSYSTYCSSYSTYCSSYSSNCISCSTYCSSYSSYCISYSTYCSSYSINCIGYSTYYTSYRVTLLFVIMAILTAYMLYGVSCNDSILSADVIISSNLIYSHD